MKKESVSGTTHLNATEESMTRLALMDHAGVPLPPGTLGDFVSIRVPAPQPSGVDTEFHPWNNQEVQSVSAGQPTANLGEIRLGDNVQAHRVHQEYPVLGPNQVRLLQLRALVHEVFHALDFYRTAVVLERNGLLFPELRQSLSDYRAYWQGQGPLSKQASAGVLVVLNRTRYP